MVFHKKKGRCIQKHRQTSYIQALTGSYRAVPNDFVLIIDVL
jgi:hypothetical protein